MVLVPVPDAVEVERTLQLRLLLVVAVLRSHVVSPTRAMGGAADSERLDDLPEELLAEGEAGGGPVAGLV